MTSCCKKTTMALVLAVALFLVWDSLFIVDETQQGVVTHFGKISLPVRGPGLHIKWPRPISKVYKTDRRIHTLTNLTHELITEDQKNILVDGHMLWRIQDPVLYVESIRTGENAVNSLKDLYHSSAGIVISNKALEAFIGLGLQHEDIDEVSIEILAKIAPVAKTNYGIEVIRAGIVEYALPQANRPSVIQRMISERARIAARYRSEGEEKAIRIEAMAINEHQKIMAQAHAKATRILGKAEAKAMELLGQAYRKDPSFYKFVRALDSYDLIIDKNTTLMLPADNELFKYLDSKAIPK